MRGALILCLAASMVAGCRGPALEPWHTKRLHEEFTARRAEEITTLDEYRRLEAALFDELEREVYERTPTGHEYELVRYSAGSAADPRSIPPDWNRTFELGSRDGAIGGVLLLHGMSDSPYSLRALGERLSREGYLVLGLRLPGHGTAPSGLKHVDRNDMRAAVRLGMHHLSSTLGAKPIHVIGYSTGAALAVELAMDAVQGDASTEPASLVLISPAVRIHPTARLAGFKNALAMLPGLGRLAWLQVLPEFDPYKYNSFATNAGAVVHGLTRAVDRQLGQLDAAKKQQLPPILVLKSTVDATVSTDAVVDGLLGRLAPHRNELVLFDVNRRAAKAMLMVANPGPLTNRLHGEADLPFAITFVTNESAESSTVVARRRRAFVADASALEPLDAAWPAGVVSLSHIALPFPPDDPLYGRDAPSDPTRLFLGDFAIRGERGLLALSPEWLLRMRYNPFYDFGERRVLEWLAAANGSVP